MKNTRTLRFVQATLSMLALAAVWQLLSHVFPPFLFPPVPPGAFSPACSARSSSAA